jgi:hypothetical protein
VVLRPHCSVPSGEPEAGGRALTTSLAIEDRRDELFWCSHFGRELARKHCLRRQTDMRKDGGAWLPVLPFCATSCSLGRENRALLAGFSAEPCAECGAALVGGEECSTCREKRELHLVKPRAVPRPPPQGRIWAGGVPDVPIGAPRVETKKAPEVPSPPAPAEPPDRPAPSASRERTSTDGQAAKLRNFEISKPQHQTPAVAPAEESGMPKGKRSAPCPECKSISTRCKKDCPTRKRVKAYEAVLKEGTITAAEFRAADEAPTATGPVQFCGEKLELRQGSDEEIFALAAAVKNELVVREHAAAARLAALQKARAAA